MTPFSEPRQMGHRRNSAYSVQRRSHVTFRLSNAHKHILHVNWAIKKANVLKYEDLLA